MSSPLALDLNVSIRHEESGVTGTVIDVFSGGALIRGQWQDWPVYVVQFEGHSSNGTARQWAKRGFKIV